MKFSARYVACVGVLSALSVVLNVATFTVVGSANALSFTYLPTFVAGFYFGPAAGFIVGILGDVLGCLIHPQGPWLPLITLASALMGAIPGVVKKLPVKDTLSAALSLLIVFALCSVCLNTLALWLAYARTKKTFWVYLLGRFPLQLTNFVANVVIIFATFPVFQKLLKPHVKSEAVRRA